VVGREHPMFAPAGSERCVRVEWGLSHEDEKAGEGGRGAKGRTRTCIAKTDIRQHNGGGKESIRGRMGRSADASISLRAEGEPKLGHQGEDPPRRNPERVRKTTQRSKSLSNKRMRMVSAKLRLEQKEYPASGKNVTRAGDRDRTFATRRRNPSIEKKKKIK